jgi:hypothetical protein
VLFLILLAPLLFEDDDLLTAPVLDDGSRSAQTIQNGRSNIYAVATPEREHVQLNRLAYLSR